MNTKSAQHQKIIKPVYHISFVFVVCSSDSTIVQIRMARTKCAISKCASTTQQTNRNSSVKAAQKHLAKNVKNAKLHEINLQIDAEQLSAKTKKISLFGVRTHIINKHKLSLPWLTINAIDFYCSKNKKTDSNENMWRLQHACLN